MQPQTLREKHPLIRYRSYKAKREGDYLFIEYLFELEPKIIFRPRLFVPVGHSAEEHLLLPFIFNLGMVELISYWKAACPPRIVVEAGELSSAQIEWWSDLFLHGLGEFYYRNEIDFTVPDFFSIEARSSNSSSRTLFESSNTGVLVFVGGGKDSSLTLELLKDFPAPKTALMLNPTRAALESASIAGYTHPLLVKRTIDPALLRLNDLGYLNGHTPFSAYLAFLGALCGAANCRSDLIVSNERSASEGNIVYRGLPVNHQYSKSFRFETRFRDYLAAWLSPSQRYFSFLRPLHDIQVAKIFSAFDKQLLSFRSCNVAQARDAWCLNCPKCAFVYLTLFPFAPPHLMDFIFGGSLFDRPEIHKQIMRLCGYEEIKPFECVGTIKESRAAAILALQRYEDLNLSPPEFLAKLGERIHSDGLSLEDALKLLNHWGKDHYLAPEYEVILREALLWSEEL